MIRMRRQFFWRYLKVTGKKRYQNDTRTIPQNAIWEPGAGGRPPTHPTEQNIDTLSALGQLIPIPYFISGSTGLKKGKEEPNKATSIQHRHCNVHLKMQIWWIDQIQYPISLELRRTGHSPSDMLCHPAETLQVLLLLKGSKRTHTHTQTKSSFLTVFAGERAFQ